MQEYVLELSKYFINILMVLYVFAGFLAFGCKDRKGKLLYGLQIFLMFLLQIITFLDLTFANDNMQYMIYFAFVQLILIMGITLVPLVYEKINRQLLIHIDMLIGIGMFILCRLSVAKFKRQYVIALISFGVSLVIPYILTKVRFLKKLKWIYAGVGLTMLSTVLVLGEVTHGSKISYTIAGVTFQPSEFVKILFVFFLAASLWEDTSIKRVILTSLIAGAHVLILVISKDLGGGLLLFVTYLLVLFVATGSYWYLLGGTVAGGIASVIAYYVFEHVKVRVLAWRDPWSYIDREGYQITQSLFAIGGGKWFGMGLMQGNPKVIPYVEADLIFSSICEELGVIFGICLIFICVQCFLTIMQTAMKIHDRFYRFIVYGIGIIYISQIFLTIGGGIKLIPLTGVTLPFISYGGSSIMTTMIMFFIVQGFYMRLQREEVRRVDD